MPGTSLITGYLATLSRQLPQRIVEELASGLDETYHRYLDSGLGLDAAARAAITEFGDPRLITASFAAACPGRHLARRLLACGPVAGLCWAAALIASRAWSWPLPPAVPIAAGSTLLAGIALLVIATLGRSYRAITRAAAAACATITLLDLTLVALAIGLATAHSWELALAMTASGLRIGYSTRALPGLVAR